MLGLLAAGIAASSEIQAQAPVITPGGIVNSASYTAPLAPGSLATAFGSFPVSAPIPATTLPLPPSLGGISLVFGNNQPAPLLYAAPEYVNFQVPWEFAGMAQVTVVAMGNGLISAAQTVSLAPFAPAIFSLNTQGTGQGQIFDTTLSTGWMLRILPHPEPRWR